MSEDDLIGAEALATVGTVVAEARGTVTKKEFQRWAAAVGDRNPVYFDDDAARAAGYREAVAPPLYLQHVTLGVVDLEALRPDGVPEGSGTSAAVPLPSCARLMAGGEEWTFHAPVYAGDALRSTRTIVSVEQKHGRSGDFVVIRSLNRYVRESDDRVVAEATSTSIARP